MTGGRPTSRLGIGADIDMVLLRSPIVRREEYRPLSVRQTHDARASRNCSMGGESLEKLDAQRVLGGRERLQGIGLNDRRDK